MFLVAGGLVAIVAMLWAAELAMDMATSEAKGFFGPAGFAVAFVAMFGMYTALADRTPWLARAGVLFAVVGFVGTSMVALATASQLVGLIQTRPAWVDLVQRPFLIGIVLGFLTFGVAVLRTDAYSRPTGLLLLGPAIMFPSTLVAVAVWGGGDFPYVIHVIHNSAEALALLGVGYLLRINGVPTERAEPAPDTAPR